MKQYMKINSGYHDLNRYVVIRQGVYTQIENVETHKREVMTTNKFLHDYMEVK